MKLVRQAFAFISAFLWASVLWSATTATVTPGVGVDLYRGSTVIQRALADQATCQAAARADAQARAASAAYRCWPVATRIQVTYTADAPPPPTPPTGTGGPTISVSPANYAVGGYATLSWKCGAPCVRSAVPADARFSGDTRDDWSISVAPNVSTVYTVTDPTGSKSVGLTVTGSAPIDPPPAGGGGSTGGGTTNPPPVTNLPVPTVLPTPIQLPINPIGARDPIIDFAHTAMRDWNWGGFNADGTPDNTHVIPEPFDPGQGYWSYETCTQNYAVWLFDRPGAFFKLHKLTGNAAYLDQAISDTRYFASHINAAGYFDCKTGEADTKYLVTRPFLEYERATGDQSLRPVAARMYAQSAQGFPTTYSTSEALWTEREVGIHGDAALAYYELTGDTQALARAAAMVKQWTDMGGTTTAPMVSITQHEGGGPGGTTPTDPISSPWMSAVYFQFARNYWQITGDEQVLRQASAYFDWLDANAIYDGSLAHPELTGITIPRYYAPSFIGEGGYDESNMMHCPAVAGLVAFALDAKGRLGLPIARAQQRLTELQGCIARNYAHWTREATFYPKFRIQNPRFYNLWIGGLHEAAR